MSGSSNDDPESPSDREIRGGRIHPHPCSTYSAHGVQDSPNERENEFVAMVLDSNKGSNRWASTLLETERAGVRNEPHARESTPASTPVIMEMS
ncbi:MAG: hypothetical protein CMJ40_02940 [Phycisphaerae bacterium]|nr:hypothetical protein [Phycisphaerae bacterium]